MTRDQVWAMCEEVKRLSRQSFHHTLAGSVVIVANCVAVVALHMHWQSWLLIPMASALWMWGDREMRRAKKLLDQLNTEVLRK